MVRWRALNCIELDEARGAGPATRVTKRNFEDYDGILVPAQIWQARYRGDDGSTNSPLCPRKKGSYFGICLGCNRVALSLMPARGGTERGEFQRVRSGSHIA